VQACKTAIGNVSYLTSAEKSALEGDCPGLTSLDSATRIATIRKICTSEIKYLNLPQAAAQVAQQTCNKALAPTG